MPKDRTKDATKKQDIFSMLEKFHGNEIPDCVKAVLRFSAYDTACSLAELNEKQISGIEEFINQSDRLVLHNLDCCNAETYKNQERFRFLPGHSSILLGIPTQLKKMHESKKKPYKKLTEFSKLLTSAELESILLQKLNQHMEKTKMVEQFGLFTAACISSMQTSISNNTMLAKCSVECPNCNLIIPILFNGYWVTSNVFRHLKSGHQNSNSAETRVEQNALGSLTAINGAEPSSEHSANNEYNGFTFEEIIVECLSDEDATGSNGTAISDVNSPASSPVVSKRAKGSTIKSLQLGMGQSIRFNMNVES